MEAYTGEPPKKIEPCEYWKQNSTTYPALFYCAQIFPASSVPSESLFSEAGQQNNKIMVIKGNI